jgi:NADPH-dependent glutamate synthase beta subunit-like oxidoreductase
MRPFSHINARSIDSALATLKGYRGKARLIAGCTDLLGALKNEFLPDYPQAIINIKGIEGLDSIREDGEGLKIGALATLADIAASPLINEKYKVLAEAARSIATPQVRNAATVGGNLAQDVRCWYYRYPDPLGGRIVCLRKGGKVCNALFGDNRYHSIFGSARMEQYPCSSHCPASTDIPDCLSKVKSGDLSHAAEILLAANPMPAVTGRVCPIFCEPACNRCGYDEPVAIRCVERFLGDHILEDPGRFFRPPSTESGRKVAIIGSGPAGLAAAYYLRRDGHGVTVFERAPEPGGMLVSAIPPYRLPKGVVEKEIRALEAMGITFRCGVTVGKGLATAGIMETFDAVFAAAGAWKERSLGIKGEEIALSGLSFLNRVNTGSREMPWKRVAVIGGGNVAMDVARILLRLGARPLVLYRRTRNEMPALKDEIVKAEEEGIPFKFLTLAVEAARIKDSVLLTCRRMKLGPPDASGRRTPVPKEGSDFTMTVDAVIKAIGEEADTSFLPATLRRRVKRGGRSPLFLDKNLFAGGDFVTGPSTVIEAVTSGRNAARAIHLWLRGDEPSLQAHEAEPHFAVPSYDSASRIRVPVMARGERIKGLDEEDGGTGAEAIVAEAGRCFNCGCVAVSPSDIGMVLVALDASIVTTTRALSAQEFFSATATRSTILADDELITEIHVPKPAAGSRQIYSKFTLRKPIDFAVASVACVVTMQNGVCSEARIALGGVAAEPVRARAAEKFLAERQIDSTTAEAAAHLAVEGAKPLSENAYKIEIIKTLVKRAIVSTSCSGSATSE